MKILAFAASNSRNSINRKLVGYATERLRLMFPGLRVKTLDINDYEMPIYSADREAEAGIPAPARDFYDIIGAADAVLVSFAEHNGSTTAAWKNIFDWMSRIDKKVWQGKPLVMLAASPGARGGANVLASQATTAPHFGADLKGTHGVGDWYQVWDDSEGKLLSQDDIDALDSHIGLLVPELV